MSQELIDLLEERKQTELCQRHFERNDCQCCGRWIRAINEVLDLLNQKPTAGDFTNKNRERIKRDWSIIESKNAPPEAILCVAGETLEHLEEACDCLDTSEAENRELKAADKTHLSAFSGLQERYLQLKTKLDTSEAENKKLKNQKEYIYKKEIENLKANLKTSEAINKIKDKRITEFEVMVKAGGECCDILQERIDILSEGKAKKEGLDNE